MAANEIAERIAAHAWLRLGPTISGEGEVEEWLDPSTIGYRSQVGFTDTILTASDVATFSLLILLLDRQMARTENQVFANRIFTTDSEGHTYPIASVAQPMALAVQPIMREWLGDLAAPTWYPFLANTLNADNHDIFDALAILLPQDDDGEEGARTLAGDIVIHILKSPYLEAGTTVEAVIEPPAP